MADSYFQQLKNYSNILNTNALQKTVNQTPTLLQQRQTLNQQNQATLQQQKNTINQQNQAARTTPYQTGYQRSAQPYYVNPAPASRGGYQNSTQPYYLAPSGNQVPGTPNPNAYQSNNPYEQYIADPMDRGVQKLISPILPPLRDMTKELGAGPYTWAAQLKYALDPANHENHADGVYVPGAYYNPGDPFRYGKDPHAGDYSYTDPLTGKQVTMNLLTGKGIPGYDKQFTGGFENDLDKELRREIGTNDTLGYSAGIPKTAAYNAWLSNQAERAAVQLLSPGDQLSSLGSADTSTGYDYGYGGGWGSGGGGGYNYYNSAPQAETWYNLMTSWAINQPGS